MAKNTLSREAKRMGESKRKPLETKPKASPEKVAVPAAPVAPKVVEVVPVVVAPVVPEPAAVVVKKPKKARFVRPKQEKKPAIEPVALPARSTKVSGKLMTKNLKHVPNEKPTSFTKRPG